MLRAGALFDAEAATRLSVGARGVLPRPVTHETPDGRETADGGETAGLEGFSLVARTCVRGPRGSLWNEWTLRCDHGGTKFLAETADALVLFEEGSLLPPLEGFHPGATLETAFVVVERGIATRLAQWGESEDSPRSYAFVDLASRSAPGTVATVDFGGPAGEAPRTFLGRRVTAAELGLTTSAEHPLLVPMPELSRPKGVELWLSPGDRGELLGEPVAVLGSISRSMAVDDEDELVRWDEYLLASGDETDARAGFRWLARCDGHFNLVEELDAGRVEPSPTADGGVVVDGVAYAPVSEGTAKVEWASGRLPWEVTLGSTSVVTDFAHAPYLLTKERTVGAHHASVSWSRGRYLPSDVIAKSFGKRTLPRPVGRPPNAPPSSSSR